MIKKIDLGKEKELKLFYSYVVPAILGMLAINTATIVDSYFIGNYIGAEAIGAITLIGPFMSIMIGVASMIVLGGVVLAGIEYGKGDFGKSNHYFNLTFVLTIIAGLIIWITFYFSISHIVINVMDLSSNIIVYIFDYFYTILIFTMAYMLMSFFSFFIKLDGMPNLVVLVTVLSVMINIVLDYLLVGLLGFGMKGAAFATGLSQIIPCIMFFMITIKKSSFHFKIPKFNFNDIKLILFNGSSELLGLSAIGFAGYIYNIFISKRLGVDGISAFGIAMQIANVAVMIFYGISDGIQSIVSYNYGAKLFKRVENLRNIAFTTSFIFGILICIGMIFYGEELATIFVKKESIVKLSAEIMIYYAIALTILGVNLNATTYYTALGQPLKSAIIAITRSFIGLILGLIILPYFFGEIGLWLPLIFSELITFVLVYFYVKKYPYGFKKIKEVI